MVLLSPVAPADLPQQKWEKGKHLPTFSWFFESSQERALVLSSLAVHPAQHPLPRTFLYGALRGASHRCLLFAFNPANKSVGAGRFNSKSIA